MAAPAPKADRAIPVANPRLSGNHFMTVVTGLRYINPHPMPPNNPQPAYSNSKECKWTPAAVVKRPADQKADPTNPDFRGPTFSTHDPKVDVYDV
jgi:hypothetical protein